MLLLVIPILLRLSNSPDALSFKSPKDGIVNSGSSIFKRLSNSELPFAF